MSIRRSRSPPPHSRGGSVQQKRRHSTAGGGGGPSHYSDNEPDDDRATTRTHHLKYKQAGMDAVLAEDSDTVNSVWLSMCEIEALQRQSATEKLEFEVITYPNHYMASVNLHSGELSETDLYTISQVNPALVQRVFYNFDNKMLVAQILKQSAHRRMTPTIRTTTVNTGQLLSTALAGPAMMVAAAPVEVKRRRRSLLSTLFLGSD